MNSVLPLRVGLVVSNLKNDVSIVVIDEYIFDIRRKRTAFSH